MAIGEKYEDDGVVVIEVLQVAETQDDLVNYMGDWDHLCFRVGGDNPAQMIEDWQKTNELTGMAHYTLIDLTSMKVIVSDCGISLEDGEACIEDNL